MAVEQSVLNYSKIKHIMIEEYGIIVNKVCKIERGSANIYEIFSNTGHFILKEFQEKIDVDKVKIEYLVIEHLKANSIPTPEYMINKKGNICCEYDKRMIIVQRFIEGSVIDSNTSDKEQIIDSVHMYSAIVKSLENYPYELPSFKRHIMSKELCKKDIESIENLLKISENIEINKALLHKKEILLKFEEMDFKWIEKLTYKKSHGDYDVFQFIYDENGKIKAVLDFAATRRMPIARELIRNYFFMAKEIKDQVIDFDFFVEYIKEFCKYQPLNYYDLKYMPLLYLIELSRTVYGYQQYILNKSKGYLNFGNELYNQCVCVERFGEELSNRLLKLNKE